MKKTLVMYTMNEIEGVKGIFEKIPIDLFDQFIVMDNHSNDGTVEFLEEHDVNVIQQKNPGRRSEVDFKSMISFNRKMYNFLYYCYGKVSQICRKSVANTVL